MGGWQYGEGRGRADGPLQGVLHNREHANMGGAVTSPLLLFGISGPWDVKHPIPDINHVEQPMVFTHKKCLIIWR